MPDAPVSRRSFLDTLLFPIRLVITSIAGAIFSLDRLQYYQGRGYF